MWDGFFSPRISESRPSRIRRVWDSETSGEKSISRGKPYKMHFIAYFTQENHVRWIYLIAVLCMGEGQKYARIMRKVHTISIHVYLYIHFLRQSTHLAVLHFLVRIDISIRIWIRLPDGLLNYISLLLYILRVCIIWYIEGRVTAIDRKYVLAVLVFSLVVIDLLPDALLDSVYESWLIFCMLIDGLYAIILSSVTEYCTFYHINMNKILGICKFLYTSYSVFYILRSCLLCIIC